MIDAEREALNALEMGRADGRLRQSVEISIMAQEALGSWYTIADVIQLAKLALEHGLTLPERRQDG